jgi:DNA-binding transcriptional LysR family regulator
LPAQLKRMREAYPDIALTLRENNVANLLADVLAGSVDAALVRAPAPLAAPLTYRTHSSQALVAVLPKDHPLAQHRALALAQLAPTPMIGLPDTDSAGIMLIAARLAAACGATLNIAWKVSDVGSALGLVAAGLGYAIVPQGLAQMAGHQVATRPLTDAGAVSELWLAWHSQRITPALQRFLDLAAPTGVDADPPAP